MKIGISTWSLGSTGAKTLYELIDAASENGFECLDLTLDHYHNNQFKWMTASIEEIEVHFKELKEYADKKGITFSQVHAPYGLFPDYLFDHFFQLQVKSIIIAGIIKAPYVVMHPLVFPIYMQKDMDMKEKQFNIEFLSRFIPHLEKAGTKIALENIYDWDNDRKHRYLYVSRPEGLRDYLDSMPNDMRKYFGLCLDTGHLNMAGYKMDDIVAIWKNDLKVLHINDNNGTLDDHFMPYMGTFDWTDFVKKLKSIGYEGDLSIEVKPFPYLGKIKNGHKFAAELTKALNEGK